MLLSCIPKKEVYTGAILAVMAITTSGWSPRAIIANENPQLLKDTVPGKNRSNNHYDNSEYKGIDQRIEHLEKVLEKLDRQLQSKNLELMGRNLQESLGQIDLDAIQRQVEEAMQRVDFSKIQVEAAAAMKQIDLQKIQLSIQDALAQAKDKTEIKKLQQELRESMKLVQKSIREAQKIDYDKLEKNLERSRKQWQKEKLTIEKELQEAKKEISNAKGTLEKELANAREEIQHTKEELQTYKAMITLMDKEGLINSDEDYSIYYRNGLLMINGKEQTPEISDQYKSYFKKNNVHIKREKDNFTITTDNSTD